MERKKYKTVDEFIEELPIDTQKVLRKIRSVIKKSLPKEAEETISYNIPTYKINGKYVIYFAGFEKHVSIYPMNTDMGELTNEIKPYLSGKGTAKFPLNKPIPYDLIEKVVTYKLRERLKTF